MSFEGFNFVKAAEIAFQGAPAGARNAEVEALGRLYAQRFQDAGLAKRQGVWRVLCDRFFSKLVPPDATVLDLACGYGEFVNNIRAGRKYAVDLNADAGTKVAPGVRFVHGPASDLSPLPQSAFDTVFASNLLEHFKSKAELDQVLSAVRGVLKPGGQFIILGPNIRYCHREYWDFYDHHLALSDRSLAEALGLAGYRIDRVIPRFLPFTMNGKTPAHPLLVRLYLAMPFAWRILGKQFLVVASRSN